MINCIQFQDSALILGKVLLSVSTIKIPPKYVKKEYIKKKKKVRIFFHSPCIFIVAAAFFPKYEHFKSKNQVHN